ncbi:MAG: polyphosphate:AMP phosphotransferase [Planctomycetes bacterium]|nr:polyphosphate:AMP phosphotransferase [Planctomycetota bacterium]
MFETAELGRTIGKAEFQQREPELRTKLLAAQEELKGAKFPVIIVIGGVDGAGKGETVNILHEWMDPRYLEAHAFGPLTDEESERPEFWRFWRLLPPKGRIGIFFGSWYTRPIVERVYGLSKGSALKAALVRINNFERELADDGALVLKFWLHLSKEGQKKRLKKLEKNPRTRWRVTDSDWKHFKLYDRFRKVSEKALRETSTGHAPWIVIEGGDTNYRHLTAGTELLTRLTKRLAQEKEKAARPKPPKPEIVKGDQPTILDSLDLTKTLEKKAFTRRLEDLQGRLNMLYRQAVVRKVGSILVFEGPDAAGKGSTIRRITAALDARGYQVIPVAAPTQEERGQHYLWRFWRHLPRAGRVTVYDRSWYGRVLVERVEGFCSEEDWQRAYGEINDFEEQLCEHGILVLKFWIQVSPDEQLRRFKEREQISFKRYKITEEDYRNREKWPGYEVAANEMIGRTSSEFAPWTLVEGDNKYYARLKVMQTFCDRLAKAVK